MVSNGLNKKLSQFLDWLKLFCVYITEGPLLGERELFSRFTNIPFKIIFRHKVIVKWFTKCL